MATLKDYYGDFSLDRGTAELLELRDLDGRPAALLDRTIFYPEGGGQSADRGSIAGTAVLDVQEAEGEVLHFLDPEGAAGLRPGPVELRLDGRRRRDYATQHSAQHLLSATILRLTGVPTLSMHLGEEVNTIDVDSPDLAAADWGSVEEAVHDIVEADYPILIHLCPPEDIDSFPLRKKPPVGEEVIRVVEIDGYDYSPCCGTHLPSTGAIGMVKILGAEKYKGMTRVSFIAGRRVLRDLRSVRAAAERAGRTLKSPVLELDAAAAALAEKSAQQERTLLNLKEQAAQAEAERLLAAAGPGPLLVRYNDRSMDEVLRVGRALQKLTETTVLAVSGAERKIAALSSRKDADLRPALKRLLEGHGGKGGGGPSFYQGAFSSASELDSFVAAARKEL